MKVLLLYRRVWQEHDKKKNLSQTSLYMQRICFNLCLSVSLSPFGNLSKAQREFVGNKNDIFNDNLIKKKKKPPTAQPQRPHVYFLTKKK